MPGQHRRLPGNRLPSPVDAGLAFQGGNGTMPSSPVLPSPPGLRRGFPCCAGSPLPFEGRCARARPGFIFLRYSYHWETTVNGIELTPRPAACGRRHYRTMMVAGAVLALATLTSPVRAQNAEASRPAAAPDGTKVLTVDDYGRWRTIGNEALSSDGRWVTWVYRFTNVAQEDAKPELHILDLQTDEDTTIADASNPTFSPDGRWIAYQVDSTPAQGGRGGGGGGGNAPAAQGGRGGERGLRGPAPHRDPGACHGTDAGLAGHAVGHVLPDVEVRVASGPSRGRGRPGRARRFRWRARRRRFLGHGARARTPSSWI